jgi:hypothetical protein
MRLKTAILTILMVAFTGKIALAGEFYKIHPGWLEYIYYLLLFGLIIVCLSTSYSIFTNLKGGKLSLPWLFVVIALAVVLIRTFFGILTVFNIQYFQAMLFAGLDILFFILLLTGLVLYKVGLD